VDLDPRHSVAEDVVADQLAYAFVAHLDPGDLAVAHLREERADDGTHRQSEAEV
jgi:hypothetical protein